jgi:hypothetical protein
MPVSSVEIETTVALVNRGKNDFIRYTREAIGHILRQDQDVATMGLLVSLASIKVLTLCNDPKMTGSVLKTALAEPRAYTHDEIATVIHNRYKILNGRQGVVDVSKGLKTPAEAYDVFLALAADELFWLNYEEHDVGFLLHAGLQQLAEIT